MEVILCLFFSLQIFEEKFSPRLKFEPTSKSVHIKILPLNQIYKYKINFTLETIFALNWNLRFSNVSFCQDNIIVKVLNNVSIWNDSLMVKMIIFSNNDLSLNLSFANIKKIKINNVKLWT